MNRDPSPFWPMQNARPIRSNPDFGQCKTLVVVIASSSFCLDQAAPEQPPAFAGPPPGRSGAARPPLTPMRRKYQRPAGGDIR